MTTSIEYTSVVHGIFFNEQNKEILKTHLVHVIKRVLLQSAVTLDLSKRPKMDKGFLPRICIERAANIVI